MGQQQLLLVILVTIIVGIATVVAINTFGTAADQANIDAVTNDVATLASAAQGYYMRPAMLGGGSRTFDGSANPDSDGLTFEGLAFPSNGIDATARIAENENGRYVIAITAGTTDEFTITAHPSSCSGYTPGAINDDPNNGPVGVLTPGDNCDATATVTATVTPNNFTIN